MARFLGPVLVRTVSTEIMGGSMSLVDGSQKMANLLFTAMQKRNPAAGDLAVVRAFDPSANHEMLAVLKLDLRTGFRREVVETAQGVKVRLQPVPDLMPDRDRRLQKAAFIPQPPHNYPYDLMVLDNQAGGREVGAAGFFVDDFLQCELLDGPRELTRRLPQEVEKWLQEESLAPGIALETREAVIQALHQPEVDLEVLANEAFHDSEHRSSFLDYMETAGFEGGGFSTDPAVADRIASTLTYILDGGVRISGDAETIAQILKVDPDPTDEGKARLVIESFRFERKY
jgi:hypothetical protein